MLLLGWQSACSLEVAAMQREAPARTKSRAIVFVVEDDQLLASAVCELLRDAGYAPRCAMTAAEAARYLDELVPDCVVLDMHLPDGSAEDLLSKLARSASVPPTVLLSGAPRAKELATRFAVALVPKPFDCDVFLAAVETAVQCRIRPREARTA